MDARAPMWWGNLLLIFIETMTMGLLVASYFYIRRNFWEWPPPRGMNGIDSNGSPSTSVNSRPVFSWP